MPPHLLVKAAFVRGEKRKDEVRTEYILQNIYSYLLEDRFPGICAMNEEEKNAFHSVKETVKAFQVSYSTTVKSLCSEIDDITENNVDSVLLGVSNELFSEGITWARIVAFIAFIGELMSLNRNSPKYIVDVMYDTFSKLVKEKLEQWILDHGGWSGVKSLKAVQKNENSSWAKNLLYGQVRVIGTLAKIANFMNPY